MAEQTKRQQLETHLAARAIQDPDFRERLLRDPKATIEAEIGLRFPTTVVICVYEEKLNQLHVVLPIALSTGDDLLASARPRSGETRAPFWKAG